MAMAEKGNSKAKSKVATAIEEQTAKLHLDILSGPPLCYGRLADPEDPQKETYRLICRTVGRLLPAARYIQQAGQAGRA
ncbi:hypothetical protein GCM10023149_21410 [Mucilaginibacter gynuensis]|uniref:Uncharacterized protein n=1 Tax=Mucilaginibacter gynuensis TaxID=1302236 RepID=A0ABP8GCJ2_9SPHI